MIPSPIDHIESFPHQPGTAPHNPDMFERYSELLEDLWHNQPTRCGAMMA